MLDLYPFYKPGHVDKGLSARHPNNLRSKSPNFMQSEVGPSEGNRPRSCLPFLIVQGQNAAGESSRQRRAGGR